MTYQDTSWQIMTYYDISKIIFVENSQLRHFCCEIFFITRLSIAFEDLLASSIAPQVLPAPVCANALKEGVQIWTGAVCKARNQTSDCWHNLKSIWSTHLSQPHAAFTTSKPSLETSLSLSFCMIMIMVTMIMRRRKRSGVGTTHIFFATQRQPPTQSLCILF